jgi:NAD(P)-dependent dehydrogenase (short-subunit alcohol dehydrogenase family)
MVELCCTTYGSIDVMVANAGVSGIKRTIPHFLDQNADELEQVWKVNVLGR